MDFDEVRWKLADSLTPEEAAFIVENKEKLNAEEKDAFAQIIQEATPLPEDPLTDQLDKAGEPKEPVTPEPVTPAPAAAPVAPTLPEDVVTKDKLDSYLAEKRKEWDAEGKTKAEQTKEEEQIKFELFGQGEVPDDWNAAVNKFAPAIIDAAEKRILARLDKQNLELEENRAKLQQTQKEVFERFEQEFATLAQNKLIPDPKESPEEYQKTKDAILAVGDAHGKSNITDAYKLWSIIPVDKGGGYAVAGAPVDDEKSRIEAQKAAAGKIGSGRGTVSPKKGGTPSWNTIHATRMEDLIEQRLRQS